MELHVTSQEAAATLEKLLDRVSEGGTTVVIERGGKAVGQIIAAPTDAFTTPGGNRAHGGKVLSAADVAAITSALRELGDDWADAAEEAVRIGNQPLPRESPWDR